MNLWEFVSMYLAVTIGKKTLAFGEIKSGTITEVEQMEAHRRCADLIKQAPRIGVGMAIRDAYLRGIVDALIGR